MPEKYNELQARFRKEQKKTREEIERHEKSNINYFELGVNLLELSQKAKEIYLNRHSAEDKRQLLNLIFLNLTLKEDFVYKTYKKPFQIISERVKTNTVRRVFEKIRTDFARDWLGGRPRNYLASLEVRGKNSPKH